MPLGLLRALDEARADLFELSVRVMDEPIRVVAMDFRPLGDDVRRQPDAGFQAEAANLPGQPLHAVGETVVALPIAKGAVKTVIHLHVFEAERLKVARGELRLP